MSMALDTKAAPVSGAWNIGIWVGQAALAALYLMAAWMHGTWSVEQFAAMGAVWVGEAPMALVRFIGIAELLGAIGVILPAATRVRPELTVWAAVGLLVIQLLAIPFHAVRGEFAPLPMNFIYLALCVFVLWGRARKAPVSPRS